MKLLMTKAREQESCPCPSPATVLRKTGLTLSMKHSRVGPGFRSCRKAHPKGVSMGDLALPLICPGVDEGETLPLALCHLQQVGELVPRSEDWDSYLCLSLAAALRRSGSTPRLGTTVEVTLLAGA